MRVRDLGVPLLVADAVEIAGTGARQTALLALLVLEADRRVTTDALLVAAWGYDSETSVSVLENHIWRLRKLLEPLSAPGEPSVIVTEPGGYRLAIPRATLDSSRFESLVTRARDELQARRFAEALAACDEALDLWRGAPFEAIAHLGDAAAAIARLDELHAQLLERRVDALVGVGDEHRALAELEQLVRAHPFREALRAQQMRVLDRLGRAHEALDVYRRARELLVEELGVEPGAELKALQRELLAASSGAEDDEAEAPASAPASRPASARVHLPFRSTPLVGRRTESERLDGLVRERALITIVGPGGVGKTRLAVDAARRWADAFRDGVWFIDLTETAEPALVADTVVSTLGLTARGAAGAGGHALTALLSYVSDRRLLFVLDNCEHVIAGVTPLLDRLMAAAGPGFTVIATSREPLRADDEAVLALPPLALAAGSAADEPSLAAALFLERMSALADPPADALPTVEAICAAVDGLPLAIELAAARAGVFTLAEIAAQVVEDPSRLSQPGHAAAAHRGTLWSTIEWSHRLLRADEQAVHRRLSVLPGPFTLAAAVAVAADGEVEPDDVAGILAGLAHQSLLIVSPPRGPGRPSVFRQLDTVRAHGRRHLADAGEDAAALGRRHDWVLRLLADRPRLGRAEVAAWYDALDDAAPALRATLNAASAASEEAPDLALLRATAGLPLYWYHRERLIEARQWLASAAHLVPADIGEAEPVEATIFRIVGLAAELVAGHKEGPALVLEAVLAQAARASDGDLVDVGEALVAAGNAAWSINAYDVAVPIADALTALAGRSGDAALLLQAREVDCVARLVERSDDDTAGVAERVYADAVAAGDLLSQWGASGARSVISARKADPAGGVLWVERLIPAHAYFGNGGGGAFLESSATFADQSGDPEGAVRMFAASSADLRRIGVPWPVFWGTPARLERLRAALAPGEFERLWAEGSALTYEEFGRSRGLRPGPGAGAG